MNRITEFRGEHRWLSNFWPARVYLQGDAHPYPTVEHAYQAAKIISAAEREVCRKIPKSIEAKRYARRLSIPKHANFADRKVEVMLELLRQKFRHKNLRTMLLDTGDAELIEGNTWGDTFWGVCDGVGENHLGRLLMQVRSEILDGEML